MRFREEIFTEIKSLINRYGVTICEISSRFQEKVAAKFPKEAKSEIQRVFLPLEKELLIPLRINANKKVSDVVIERVMAQVCSLPEFDEDEAFELVLAWAGAMSVTFTTEPEELRDFNEAPSPEDIPPGVILPPPVDVTFETIVDEMPIVDNTVIVEQEHGFNDINFDIEQPFVKDEIVFDAKVTFNEENHKKNVDVSDSKNKITDTHERDNRRKEQAQRDSKKVVKINKKSSSPIFNEPPPFVPEVFPSSSSSSSSSSEMENLEFAFRALRRGDTPKAVKVMMDLARNGDSRAQFHLAEFYIEGTGLAINKDKGIYWLKKAARKGHMPAKVKLEEIEKAENSGGCCGCAVVLFVGYIVLNILARIF